MKRIVNICIGIAIALFGSALASGALKVGPGLMLGGIIFGAGFGAVGALAYLGGRPDYASRIGTVFILFLGGIAVFTQKQTALALVPSATAGLLVGFAACLAFLNISEG
jgi:hypothetical protein